jgi:hypothetical protein
MHASLVVALFVCGAQRNLATTYESVDSIARSGEPQVHASIATVERRNRHGVVVPACDTGKRTDRCVLSQGTQRVLCTRTDRKTADAIRIDESDGAQEFHSRHDVHNLASGNLSLPRIALTLPEFREIEDECGLTCVRQAESVRPGHLFLQVSHEPMTMTAG